MSPSSRSHPPATAPLLTDLALLLHEGSTSFPGSVLVTIEPSRDDVALGMWPVPAEVEHPADPLIGFLAPPSWSALGLVSFGRLHGEGASAADEGGGEPDPEVGSVRLTALFGRDGETASVISRPRADPEELTEPPHGWVPDVVARALGRPTPPPDTSLAYWVERAWLDHLVGRVLRRPGSVRRWRDVAALHPLAPAGPALPGVLLALEASALDLESSWERMRLLWQNPHPVTAIQPPGGQAIDLPQWFDDGSFSRWVQRNLPEPEDLLPVLLDALPEKVADELCEALVAVGVDGV